MARACNSIFVLVCVLALMIQHVRALQVTPGSACAAVCLDNTEDNPNDPSMSATTPRDVVCTDSNYSTQAVGIKYKACQQCLQSSHVSKGSESDAAWYLYNLRYTLSVCMYSYPNISREQVVSTPCNTEYACQPFNNALRVGIPHVGQTGSLDYCEADGGVFTGSRFKGCVTCLQSSQDQTYLANFMLALKGACNYRSDSQNMLSLSGSVFQSSAIEVIDPSGNVTLSKSDTTQGMTVGAVAGIAIGASLLFLGGIGLFWVYHRKQKRMYSLGTTKISYPRMREHGMMPPFVGGGSGGTGGVGSLHSKNASFASSYDIQMKPAPTFSHTEAVFDRDIHGVMIRPVGHTSYSFNPHQAAQGPNAALPTHPAYIQHTMSRSGLTRSPSPLPPPQSKPRMLSSLSINPQMSTTAHARVHAYVMNESNSHPFVQQQQEHDSMPHMLTTAAFPAVVSSERGPSPAFSGYSSSTAPTRGPSPNDAPTARLLPAGITPPPLAASRAIKLSMPIVPKVRTSKQYIPPQIVMASSSASRHERTGSGSSSLSPDCGPGESSNVTIGLDIGNPLPQHRQRWANESIAGVGMPGQQQQDTLCQNAENGAEHQYSAGGGGWRGQGGLVRNFSNPYSRARLPDRVRRETHFEDIETPASGMSERIYG
ncbi:cell wall integrity and stress response component [Microdochium nivale]|nr:cell wall integrity and stress response component [Microdochium nivale]